MSLEPSALDHICNVVRRQIQEELPNLTLFFIAHKKGDRRTALHEKQNELLDHPAGAALLPLLNKLSETGDGLSDFAGIAAGERRRWFGLHCQIAQMAAFFINADEFKDPEEARAHAYLLAWHGISLMLKAENEPLATARTPQYDQISLARENMLGDAFCAVVLEITGHKNAIRDLARKRSLMALQPVRGYNAEEYPYPITADAVQVVFDELGDIIRKTKPVTQAIEIAQEIDITYDDNSIRQWGAFAMAAQEMAWLDFDKNKILGTSIYTSEDPYVRSTAYLVAEALNLKPAPLTDLGSYNPFTDQEVNERLHNKKCEEVFENILAKMAIDYDEPFFLGEIHQQNQRLMEGYPIGWCAHALLEASKIFQNTDQKNQHPAEMAANIFHETYRALEWESLRSICNMVMISRRQGLEITPAVIIEFCKKTEALIPVAACFQKIAAMSPPTERMSGKTGGKKIERGGISNYVSPAAVEKKPMDQ